jgi:hypothetical protein
MADQADVSFTDHGSLVVITGHTGIAKAHLAERMPEDVQTWGRGYVVEPRYVDFILDDLLSHDFTVAMA